MSSSGMIQPRAGSPGFAGSTADAFALFSRLEVKLEQFQGNLNRAAVELALTIDKMPKAVLAGDYNTKALIDAEKATWVLGGSKMGVMTRNAKWAFTQKGGADAFIGQNGGRICSYDEAMKAAYEDMYADTKMIREKRKMMKMKKMNAPAEHKH